MRSDRLLSLLLMLQARGQLTAPQAARELEVSVRTIYRDIESLSAAGVPVWATPGRAGGIALMPGYRTDVTGLTAQESRALVAMTGRAVPDDLGLGTALASAVHKLVAAMPAAHRPAAQAARERVLVDHEAWNRPGARPEIEHLPAVQQAVWDEWRVRLRYQHGDGAQRQWLVDPWGLVLKAGNWYLVAAHRGAPRLFRVDRVLAVRVLPQKCYRPADLNLEEVWATLRSGIERRSEPVLVRVRLLSELCPMVLRLTATQRTDAPVRELPDPRDRPGWVALELEFRWVGAARSFLSGFGDRVEVLAPPRLRSAIAADAAALVALYAAAPV